MRGLVARVSRLRVLAAPLALAAGLMSAAPTLAAATTPPLLPPDFFASAPPGAGAEMRVRANMLTLDSRNNDMIATGNVELFFSGYRVVADRAVYDRDTGKVTLIGNLAIEDPQGNQYIGTYAELTNELRDGFIDALVFQRPDGLRVTADRADLENDTLVTYQNGVLSPCGECIDEKGRTIGWRIRSAKVINNKTEQTYYFEAPRIELLGYTVARLPFFYVPQPAGGTVSGFTTPSISRNNQRGYGLTIPYYLSIDKSKSILFSPTLFSRQGVLFDADFTHRLENGSYSIQGWGIYQFDPGAFAGEPGDRDWRGALQTTGRFTPAENWTTGWSYTAFSDPAFLPDYSLGSDVVNEAYVTHLSTDTYADFRVSDFIEQGNVDATDQAEQADLLPSGKVEHIVRLEGGGEVQLKAQLDRYLRGADQIKSIGGVDHQFGTEGDKLHLMVEGGWTRQFVTTNGILFSPYLGLRADAAQYDGPAAVPSELFSLTPIAAMDVRWPLLADGTSTTHLIEPILQVVHRASSVTTPGITNDNSQSFLFDDSNLFSYNRFGNTDRQETGTRVSWGLHYNAQFDSGGWFDAIVGMSHQVAGVNSFAAADPALAGAGSGLDEANSHLVAGATGSSGNGLVYGAKVLVDTNPFAVSRASVGARYEGSRGHLGFDYSYVAPNPARGVTDPRHEIGAETKLPISDYWYLHGSAHYDIGAMSFASYSGGVSYDDGYLGYGASVTRYGPTSITSPDSTRFDFFMSLKPLVDFGAVGEFE